MKFAFQFPASDATPQEWQRQFMSSFQKHLVQLEQTIGEGGKASLYRVYSPFNAKTYIEFSPDGKITRVSNGVVIDTV